MDSRAIPVFELTVVPNRSSVVVELAGELDLASAPRLDQTVDDLRGVGWETIVFDVRGVEFIDSTGLRQLLDVHARARREHWRFELHGRCDVLERLLRMTGLRDFFIRS